MVLDVVEGGGLGQPMRRMKEKVLFAEYRCVFFTLALICHASCLHILTNFVTVGHVS